VSANAAEIYSGPESLVKMSRGRSASEKHCVLSTPGPGWSLQVICWTRQRAEPNDPLIPKSKKPRSGARVCSDRLILSVCLSVCLCVCIPFRTISQKFRMDRTWSHEIWQTLCYFGTLLWILFWIQTVKGQGHWARKRALGVDCALEVPRQLYRLHD